MKQERKWLIPPKPDLEDEKAKWEANYRASDYADVWSFTEDPSVRDKLLSALTETDRTVLVPGCGSRAYLQQHLVTKHPFLEKLHCTDWSEQALQRAKEEFSSSKVHYQQADTRELPFSKGSIDHVLIANSILSESDMMNREMLADCFRVLKPGGTLSGFFPSVFCAYEWSYLDARFKHFRTENIADVERNTFREPTQNMEQLFYTPLRLKRILEEAGFRDLQIELFFCESEYFKKEGERIYGAAPDSGLLVWELYVRAQVPDKAVSA